MQIDTELANEDVFVNYDNKNKFDSYNESPSAIEQDEQIKKNLMINIEGEDDMMNDDSNNSSFNNDKKLKAFFDDLKQVGPYSKQILNYTYPPLLY